MKLLFVLSVLGLVSCPICFASEGPGGSGGGDIQCEKVIRSIADDLRSWIADRGLNASQLTPEDQIDLSSTTNPSTKKHFTQHEYNQAMEAKLDLPLHVDCRPACDESKNSPGCIQLDINNKDKVCTSSIGPGGMDMRCDLGRFIGSPLLKGLTDDEQIQQVHHEYAIHIKGLEPDTGDISTYRISTQLSKFSGWESVKRMHIHAQTYNESESVKPKANVIDCSLDYAILSEIDDPHLQFKTVDNTAWAIDLTPSGPDSVSVNYKEIHKNLPSFGLINQNQLRRQDDDLPKD
jgi:hypothetical protein